MTTSDLLRSQGRPTVEGRVHAPTLGLRPEYRQGLSLEQTRQAKKFDLVGIQQAEELLTGPSLPLADSTCGIDNAFIRYR